MGRVPREGGGKGRRGKGKERKEGKGKGRGYPPRTKILATALNVGLCRSVWSDGGPTLDRLMR